MEIVTFSSPWICSESRLRPTPCPCFIAGGLLSSCAMRYLPAGTSHTMSRWIMVPSLQASCSFIKGYVVSILFQCTIDAMVSCTTKSATMENCANGSNAIKNYTIAMSFIVLLMHSFCQIINCTNSSYRHLRT